MRKKIEKETLQVRVKKSTIIKIDKLANRMEETRSETARRLLEQQLAQIEEFYK